MAMPLLFDVKLPKSYRISYFLQGLSANAGKAAFKVDSFPYNHNIYDVSTGIDITRQRDPVNVQVKVVNICAKLRPTNSRNNEIKGMNPLQKFTLLALSLNSIKQQVPLLKLHDIFRLTSIKTNKNSGAKEHTCDVQNYGYLHIFMNNILIHQFCIVYDSLYYM